MDRIPVTSVVMAGRPQAAPGVHMAVLATTPEQHASTTLKTSYGSGQ
jgi:hypothetical protein